MSRRPGTGEKFDEKIAGWGGPDVADGAGCGCKPSTYWLSRAVFLRAVSLVFFAAFASLFVQVQGLLGSDGLSPAWEVIDAQPSPATFVASAAGSTMPLVNGWLDVMCLAGMASAAVGVAGHASIVSIFICWLLYLSLCSVGGIWLEGKWDILLLETGFVAFLWAPPVSSPRRPPSYVGLILVRVVLFKVLLMQALSKLEDRARGDDWRGLTALETRYATDNIPTPTIYYYHYLPSALFQLTAAYILTVEIVGSFYVLSPINLARHWTAGFIAVVPALDALSGNYGFLPFLVLCLTVPLLEDSFWSWLLRLDDAESAPVPRPAVQESSKAKEESAPLLAMRHPSAYGTGAAALATQDSSDEEKANDSGDGADEVVEQLAAGRRAMAGWASVFDRANAERKVQVAAAVAHLVPLVLFVLVFFGVNLDAQDGESWIVVRLSPRFIHEVFGVIIPVFMVGLFLVLLFWIAVELSAAFSDLYSYCTSKRGSGIIWRRVLKLSVALATSVLLGVMGVVLTLANRAALGGIAHRPFGAVVLQERGETRTEKAADGRFDAAPESWDDKFPAFSKALRNERLPWGAVADGVEGAERSLAPWAASPASWSSLRAHGSAGGDSSWAGALFREVSPLKIANSYESKLLPSWRSEREGVNKWGGVRAEVELQSSADPDCEGGDGEWDDVDLRYAIGSVLRPPSWSGLHVPRLDWHLLAEAQHEHDWRNAPWFVTLMAKLLARPADVMSLLAFQDRIQEAAPVCVRATLFEYELARHNEFAFLSRVFGEEFAKNEWESQQTGGQDDVDQDQRQGPTWWFRTKLHDFSPPLTPDVLACSPRPDCLPEGEADEEEPDDGRRRLLSTGVERRGRRWASKAGGAGARAGAAPAAADAAALSGPNLLSKSLSSLTSFTNSVENTVLRYMGSGSRSNHSPEKTPGAARAARAARVADPRVLHERLPRETAAEEAEEMGERLGAGVPGSGSRLRERALSPSRRARSSGARDVVVGKRAAGWGASGAPDSAVRSRGHALATAAQGQLAGVGTASYMVNKHLSDVWGTGLVPNFLRTWVVVAAVAVTLAWMLWSLLYFVDWSGLATVLSSAEKAEVLCWLAGVPLLILACLLVVEVFGIYSFVLGVLAAVGMLLSIYMMDLDRQVASKPGFRLSAPCDLVDRVSTSEMLKQPSSSLALGVRNTVWGLVVYSLIAGNVILHYCAQIYLPVWIIFMLCFGAVLASIYFLQHSLTVLQLVCPVSVGLHAVNFALLWCAWGFSEQVRWYW